jgi:polysaccharide deacetylase 2 family uncharacterized protein YibQ
MTPESLDPADPSTGLIAPPTPAPTPRLPAVPRLDPAGLPTWRRFAIQPKPSDGKPVVAIIIDDLGEVRGGTERAVMLPGPLTLAWFPFARHLPEQVAAATARGHETLLHMPMQSFGNGIHLTGPDPLRVDLDPEVNLARLRTAIAAVPDAVGLNNHMGSVATRDAALMGLVAAETHRHGMLFLDSMVIPHSQGLPCALEAGVPAAGNDIFLDPIHSTISVYEQLDRAIHIAHHRGYVIAIGHPHPKTLDGLAAWLPTAADKGLVLWPLSAAVAFRNRLDIGAIGIG